ncbi:MAG: DUF1993 domain-containing protein [Bdellovibrionales bacterium]|nr:DUF1993 domain-containing protein [Bdellovibrionales bacterium]
MLYEITIPQFTKMLHNLTLIIDKATQNATERKIEMDVLLNSRLAPDQFNFIRQVQIACDTAKLFASRMTGNEAPAWEDTEKTLPEVKARIEKTIGYLNTIKAENFKGAEERKISQPRWEGKYLTGFEFATQHAIPNMYFHVTTAYAILRHNGVPVGKKDYLGEMPYKK